MQLYMYFFPGIFAFVIVIATTYLIEKCGPIIGGLIAAMPHLVVLNAAFIIINSPNETKIKEAMFTIPTGIVAEAMFLSSWKYMPKIIKCPKRPKLRLCLLIVSSFIFWSIVPLTFALFFELVTEENERDLIIPFVGISCAVLTFIIGFVATLLNTGAIESDTSNNAYVGFKIYIARGTAVILTSTLCNYLASIGLSILSGFMSVFPAMFSVTIISLWMVHGNELPTQSAASLLLGITGVNIFALMAVWLYVYGDQNIVFSLSISWINAIVLGGIPMLLFMKCIKKRNEAVLEKYTRLRRKENYSVQQSTVVTFNMDEDIVA